MSDHNRIERTAMAGAIAAALTFGAVSLAAARDGGSDQGDSLLRQEQQNPRFIQPYGWTDPATYRVGHPRAGYYLRQRIERGGAVYVQPYSRY